MIRAAVALASQAVSSGTNFLFGIYLLQNLSLSEYGIYTIGFAILLIAGSMAHGYIFIPMTVHTASISDSEKTNFLSIIQSLIFFITLILFASVGICQLFDGFSSVSTTYPMFVANSAFLASSFVLKEFYIRISLNSSNAHHSLIIHIVQGLSLVGLIGTARVLTGVSPSSNHYIFLYGAALFVAGIAGSIFTKIEIAVPTVHQALAVVKRLWTGGKWELLTSLLMTARNQSYTIVLTLLIGPIAVASANASRLLISPAVLSIPPLSQIALSNASANFSSAGYPALFRSTLKFGAFLSFVSISYSLFLGVFYHEITSLIKADVYIDLHGTTLLWCAFAVSWSVRATLQSSLQATSRFSDISKTNMFGVLAVVIFSVVLTRSYGIEGSIIAIVLGDVVVIAGLAISLFRRSH